MPEETKGLFDDGSCLTLLLVDWCREKPEPVVNPAWLSVDPRADMETSNAPRSAFRLKIGQKPMIGHLKGLTTMGLLWCVIVMIPSLVVASQAFGRGNLPPSMCLLPWGQGEGTDDHYPAPWWVNDRYLGSPG